MAWHVLMRSSRHFAITRIYNPQFFTILAAVYRLRIQKYERLEEVRSILQRRQKYNKSAIFFKDPNQFVLTQLKIENCVHYDNTLCAGESFFLVTNCGWGSTWTTRSSIPGLVPWTKSSRTTLARWAHHWHIWNPKKDFITKESQ